MCRSRGYLRSVHTWIRGRSASAIELYGCESSECQKGSEACGKSSQAQESGRVPNHHARAHGRFCWQADRPRRQWGRAQSSAVQFGSCCAGNVSCLVKVGMPCTARSSHSAWSWCRRQSQPTSRQVILRCSIKKRGAFLFPASGPRRGSRGARSLQEECGCRGGVDRGREHRDPQRQRIRRPRAPASFGPRASATYSAHVSRGLESLLWRTRRVCRRTR